jgi:hypothetical protein
LRKILGPVAVLAQGQRAAPQRRGVSPGELLKGGRLAGLGAADQLAFVVFVCFHRSRDSRIAYERFTRQDIFL